MSKNAGCICKVLLYGALLLALMSSCTRIDRQEGEAVLLAWRISAGILVGMAVFVQSSVRAFVLDKEPGMRQFLRVMLLTISAWAVATLAATWPWLIL